MMPKITLKQKILKFKYYQISTESQNKQLTANKDLELEENKIIQKLKNLNVKIT